ncbi:hypothetical protein FOC89_00480 (plasmid) [Bacillus thuringiensis]|uniref:Class IIb bacteriocin, lactobin A/cerein 7B family n=1 Tax=Bacillus thuringiensis TaxID=1428 RepID=A0A0B5NB39_BACTU|nr:MULTISPECIES: hypothetical protein [Bacillus cereus group]AJG73635.1 hypothetical protein BF38_6155 [Bacillus thuringiensis]EEM74647.1 hypothetical protein bthur0010_52610 [Bacillus thuringiensis serovar pondicheriensis BGSC 4BA1]QKH22494.1 hypothetical protein FOC89_00480 [Bacillus thuringiensis]
MKEIIGTENLKKLDEKELLEIAGGGKPYEYSGSIIVGGVILVGAGVLGILDGKYK